MPHLKPRRGILVYGPVPSRRLGFSLGVDIIPFKTCSLDCIYCQLGPTPRTTVRRRDYVPVGDILAQIKKAVRSGERIDFITFSGSGEPTLNRSIGKIIRRIKKMTSIPVAVLTNGTLLYRKDVRRDIRAADLVVPSLDAATSPLFAQVNRPHSSLVLDSIMKGLEDFRKEFKGTIWLEIMLVKGINDSHSHLRKLKAVLSRLKPDRVHLNTVVRPPAEIIAQPLSRTEMENIRKALGPSCEVVAGFRNKAPTQAFKNLEAEILTMVRRRPVTVEDIAASSGRHADEARKALAALCAKSRIRLVRFGGKFYYKPVIQRGTASRFQRTRRHS